MVISIKKRYIIGVVALILVIASAVIIPAFCVSVKPKYSYIIVIDAGHGGRDGGSVGVNGSIEKELNLKYAKALQKLLSDAGVKVVMTRTNDEGLYSDDANNKKLSDMRKRREIINNVQPDLVVSVHMNSFPLDSCKGAKTFYQAGSDSSFNAAKNIQNSLHYYIDNASSTVSAGDYYILNCTKYTSILIECGFVSSPEEEKLLQTDKYCKEFMYSVYRGIMLYLGI